MADIRNDGWEWMHYDHPDFQVQYRMNDIPAHCVLPDLKMHWHDDVEFIYVYEGSAYYYIGQEKVRIDAGQGLYVNARQRHLIEASELDCELYCLIFHPMILCSSEQIANNYIMPVLNKQDFPYFILESGNPKHQKIIQSIVDMQQCYGDGDDINHLEIMRKLYEIWMTIYELSGICSDVAEESHDVKTIKKMVAYVQENYWNKIKISDICEAGSIGKTKCNALFETYYNLTPMEYLRNYRIDKAAIMLGRSDMSITEIAYEVGFTDGSYFSKIFGQVIGCSPQQYRSYGKGLSNFYASRYYES